MGGPARRGPGALPLGVRGGSPGESRRASPGAVGEGRAQPCRSRGPPPGPGSPPHAQTLGAPDPQPHLDPAAAAAAAPRLRLRGHRPAPAEPRSAPPAGPGCRANPEAARSPLGKLGSQALAGPPCPQPSYSDCFPQTAERPLNFAEIFLWSHLGFPSCSWNPPPGRLPGRPHILRLPGDTGLWVTEAGSSGPEKRPQCFEIWVIVRN
ncbi:hypothetical protein VULLAG_LOCUS5058 [Vulpes lagopus]